MRPPACVFLIALLAGCSSSTPPPPSERDQALKRTIEEPQQRAKAVEADVLRAQHRVDEALDAADKPAEEPADG
jgi:hypothetical protein